MTDYAAVKCSHTRLQSSLQLAEGNHNNNNNEKRMKNELRSTTCKKNCIANNTCGLVLYRLCLFVCFFVTIRFCFRTASTTLCWRWRVLQMLPVSAGGIQWRRSLVDAISVKLMPLLSSYMNQLFYKRLLVFLL